MPIDRPPAPEPSISDILGNIRQRLEESRPAVPIATTGDDLGGRPLLPYQPIPASVDQCNLVSIWPTLYRLAIALGLGPMLRLWTVCRWLLIGKGGQQWVTVGDLEDATGWTRQTINNLISSGGVFIAGTVGTGRERRVYIRGQETVSERVRSLAISAGVYDAREPERSRWQLTIDQCSGYLVDFYSACFAGWVGTHKHFEYRITWELLQEAWGKTRSTLLDWIDRSGILKVNNRGVIEIPQSATTIDIYEGGLHVPFVINEYQGRRYVCYYRANTYRARDKWRKVTGSKGKGYKLNRLIDRAGVSGGQSTIDRGLSTVHEKPLVGSASQQSQAAEPVRHNFTRVDAYKGACRTQSGYLYLMVGQSRKGRMWEKMR